MIANRLRKKNNQHSDAIDTPTVEIFGAALALLIIIFSLINLIISEDIQAMLERSTENAEFKVSWTNGGEGFIIISYPDKLKILENNKTIYRDEICSSNSDFMQYVQNLYDNKKQQIIFAILEGGVKTMAVARNCMLKKNPNKKISIGWIIANSDLLNTVKLEDLPIRVKRALTKSK